MTLPSLTSAEAADLDALLHRITADRGRVGWRQIDGVHLRELTSAEALLVERAVAKRRAEFATGRSVLRALLEHEVEILRAPSGAPVLPPGFVGSLTHDDGIAVGLVTPSQRFRAVGIDIEPAADLGDDVVSLVVRDDDVTPDAVSAFVAKEAAYKAWSALGGEMLEHHDVQVIVDGPTYRAIMPGGLELRGDIGRAAGRVVACVFSPASRSKSGSQSSPGDQ